MTNRSVREWQSLIFDFTALPYFKGRICVAAHNAPNSVTIAGDEDAVLEARVVFEDEEKTAKVLFVDKAYHSHHILKSSVAYEKDIASFKPRFAPVTSAKSKWFSSVYNQDVSNIEEKLNEAYWNQNMIHTVLFADAIEKAYEEAGPFDAAIEVGPHPALKRPALESIKHVSGSNDIPYTSLFSRGRNDTLAFSDALGYLWTKLGAEAVNFVPYQKSMIPDWKPKLVTGLPTYPWDKEREYWHESRVSKSFRTRKHPTHMLLGNRMLDSADGTQYQWRNLLYVQEVPWLSGHKLQEQTVFPAAGYCSMAFEASKTLLGDNTAQLIELRDLKIHSALVFQEDNIAVETLFVLKNIARRTANTIWADWSLHASVGEHAENLAQKATGSLKVTLGDPEPLALPKRIEPQFSMTSVDTERFYASLLGIGYGYSGRFKALDNLSRRAGSSCGTVFNPENSGLDNLLVHPGALDAAIQGVLLAFCYPYDGQLFAIHVPTEIRSIKINPQLCSELFSTETIMPFQSTLTRGDLGIMGDVDLFAPWNENGAVQLEGVRCVLLAEATAADDTRVFSSTTWGPLEPDCSLVCYDMRATPEEYELASDLERACLYYLNTWERVIPLDDPARTDGPLKGLFRYSSHIREQVAAGRHKYAISEWMNDGPDVIDYIRQKYQDLLDLNIVETVGQSMPDIVAGKKTALEVLFHDDLLTRYYSDALAFPVYTKYLARVMAQLSHRYPNMSVIEIGAGTGHATKQIFNEIGDTFGTYAFTDLSSGFFDKAQEKFSAFSDKIRYQVLDIEKDIITQGYTAHSCDVVVASMVLHATRSMEKTLRNVHKLLKPGGYLVMLEMTDTSPIRSGFVFGTLPDWWAGEKDGRVFSPCIEPAQWDAVLRDTGFNGVNSITDDLDKLPFPASVIVSQACNDRINVLHDPIVELVSYSQEGLGDNLVIIGGLSLKTSRVMKSIQRYLMPYYGSVSLRKSYSDVRVDDITPTTTVLSLADLDQPVLAELTESVWAGMKAVYEHSRCLVWVTSGTQSDNPHANMSIGFGRSMLWEIPGLELQFIDIGTQPLQADAIANALLRFALANEWERKNQMDKFTYSVELELYSSETGYTIPRVKADHRPNNRFNSARRRITESVDPSQFTLCAVEEKGSFVLEKSRNLQEMRLEAQTSSSALINVQYSTAVALIVGQASSLYIVSGVESSTGNGIVGLSESVATSVLLPRCRTVALDSVSSVTADTLAAICVNILCTAILESVLGGETMIVHEPPSMLVHVLLRHSSQLGITAKFTTSRNHSLVTGPEWIYIPPNSPQRHLGNLLPRDAVKFVNLASQPDDVEVGISISKNLPDYCQFRSVSDLVRKTAYISHRDAGDVLHQYIKNPVRLALEDRTASGETPLELPEILAAGEEPALSEATKLLAIIDWTGVHSTSSIQVVTRPASHKPLLRGDRTYWLCGLTGDLGLSLAEFMARLGAKYIAFSSRNPKIDQNWLTTMSDRGCDIRVYSWYALHTFLQNVS